MLFSHWYLVHYLGQSMAKIYLQFLLLLLVMDMLVEFVLCSYCIPDKWHSTKEPKSRSLKLWTLFSEWKSERRSGCTKKQLCMTCPLRPLCSPTHSTIRTEGQKRNCRCPEGSVRSEWKREQSVFRLRCVGRPSKWPSSLPLFSLVQFDPSWLGRSSAKQMRVLCWNPRSQVKDNAKITVPKQQLNLFDFRKCHKCLHIQRIQRFEKWCRHRWSMWSSVRRHSCKLRKQGSAKSKESNCHRRSRRSNTDSSLRLIVSPKCWYPLGSWCPEPAPSRRTRWFEEEWNTSASTLPTNWNCWTRPSWRRDHGDCSEVHTHRSQRLFRRCFLFRFPHRLRVARWVPDC